MASEATLIENIVDLARYHNLNCGTDDNDCSAMLAGFYDELGLLVDVTDDLVYLENTDGAGWELEFPFTGRYLADVVQEARTAAGIDNFDDMFDDDLDENYIDNGYNIDEDDDYDDGYDYGDEDDDEPFGYDDDDDYFSDEDDDGDF
jgi:hypothetical protein